MTGLVSVSTPVAVRGALVGLGGQVDRDAARVRELEEGLRLILACQESDMSLEAKCGAADFYARAVLAGEGGT